MTTLLDTDGNLQDRDLVFADLADFVAGNSNGTPVIRADDDFEAHLDALTGLDLIAVDFKVMQDGRGFTTARLLKDRYGFEGQIVAVGAVLVDQLHSMKRVGFDLFKLREDQVVESAKIALNAFTLSYQGAHDDPKPHFSRSA